MTIQDLTNNKARIIRTIKFQGFEVKATMEMMVNYLTTFDKPTMSNIDKLTRMCLTNAQAVYTYDDQLADRQKLMQIR